MLSLHVGLHRGHTSRRESVGTAGQAHSVVFVDVVVQWLFSGCSVFHCLWTKRSTEGRSLHQPDHSATASLPSLGHSLSAGPTNPWCQGVRSRWDRNRLHRQPFSC